jgi:ribonuclease E
MPERAPAPSRRQYKIQEVIKRRQIILVQVVKEERGNKGAALTTYLSLAGRYSVLMPNTGKGGGISRKITNTEDRKRLKEVASELEVPEGMGIILRTAGASRTKVEIKRDYEYLMRMWESVRELTLASVAPRWSMRRATSSSARSATSTTRTSTRFTSPATRPIARPRTSCACSCRAMPRA